MRSASFMEILAFRGRIVLFSPSAIVGLKFEQLAEREHARIIHTRGWADAYGPIGEWHRIHASREYAVFSCDQHRYVTGVKLPATDLVWIGETGDPINVPHIWVRFSQAMGRAGPDEAVRMWLVAENAA